MVPGTALFKVAADTLQHISFLQIIKVIAKVSLSMLASRVRWNLSSLDTPL